MPPASPRAKVYGLSPVTECTLLPCAFSIDVLYLDGDRVVVHLEENLKPWRVAPVRIRAASVLELPGHTLISTRTAIGDEIEIALGRPPARERCSQTSGGVVLTTGGIPLRHSSRAGRSPQRLAGEAQTGLFPYWGILISWGFELALLVAIIVIPAKLAIMQPYEPAPKPKYDIIYYSGNELPKTEDVGGAQAGHSGRAGGREAYHPTQTIRVARGSTVRETVADAPKLNLPVSHSAVANLLALKALPGPAPRKECDLPSAPRRWHKWPWRRLPRCSTNCGPRQSSTPAWFHPAPLRRSANWWRFTCPDLKRCRWFPRRFQRQNK